MLFVSSKCEYNRKSFFSEFESPCSGTRSIFEAKVKYPTKLRKVFAFVGEVIQVGKYMHGNASLSETIFGMTRYWAGSNNIPLLKGQGGIGTKLDLGSDIVKQDMLM